MSEKKKSLGVDVSVKQNVLSSLKAHIISSTKCNGTSNIFQTREPATENDLSGCYRAQF